VSLFIQSALVSSNKLSHTQEGNTASQRLYNIQPGTCVVQKRAADGGPSLRLATMSGGSFFGELSFLAEDANATATASVVAGLTRGIREFLSFLFLSRFVFISLFYSF
jgi:CRP-like cAMP-binding protein